MVKELVTRPIVAAKVGVGLGTPGGKAVWAAVLLGAAALANGQDANEQDTVTAFVGYPR